MIRYETLILTHPEIKMDDEQKLQKHFEKEVARCQGELISFEKWGKLELAYPVWKHHYGTYYLIRVAMPENILEDYLKELQNFFRIKCTEFVMRYLNKRLDANASLEYQRPQSMESAQFASEKNHETRKESRFEGAQSPTGVKTEKIEIATDENDDVAEDDENN